MGIRPPTAEDQQAAASALRKRQAGQTPSRAESAALSRVQRYKEEQTRWEYYRTIPKTHYCRLSSRQQKVIDEQAIRYGLPIGGDTVNLAEVLTRFHDLIKESGAALLAAEAGEEDGPPTPALEKLRHERYLIARMDRLEREQQLLPRELVHTTLAQIAGQLRQLGEQLQRQHGPEVLELFNDGLDSIRRHITRLIESQAHADDPDDNRDDASGD